MTPTYKLIAQATDGGGLFCRSDISLKVLDVNDNAPSFSAPHYLASVYENAAPKALLTRLQASDPDEGKLLWCYAVNMSSKDLEMRDRILHALNASSSLYVTEHSNRWPVCEKRILLVLPNRYPAHTSFVHASQSVGVLFSPGLNRTLVYSLVDSIRGFFSIDPVSGMVILERSLDRESRDSYHLRVQATDQAGEQGALSSRVGGSSDTDSNSVVFFAML